VESDLTTPAAIAADLGIDVGEPRLQRLIRVASDAVTRYLNRTRLHYATAFVEALAAPPRAVRLVLELTPVVSVASVAIDGVALAAADWSLESADAGFLYRSWGWPFTGQVRPGLQYTDPDVGTEQRRITVTYAGGWVTPAQAASAGWAGPARSLPYEIEHAAIATAISLWHSGASDARVQSEALGSYSVTYAAGGGLLPDAARSLLDPWRRLL
jgi:hypothetical protein